MSFAKVLKVIKDNQSFVVTSHMNPDPDALGSSLGLALFLKSIGKKVIVLNEDGCPERLQFMPKSNLVKQPTKIMKCDAVLIVDCGDIKRIGNVSEVIRDESIMVNIDHHVTNTQFGDVNLVIDSSSSTAEIIADLIKKAKGVVLEDIATLLYLGIMTDTGSFRYASTTAKTHKTISELLSVAPIDVSGLYSKVYERTPREDMKRFMTLISKVNLTLNGKLATLVITKKELESFSKEFDLREKVFSFLRSMIGLEVIVIFTEHKKNITRVNFRSQSSFDVASLAAHFGGGGHVKASGCTVNESLKRTHAAVISKIKL